MHRITISTPLEGNVYWGLPEVISTMLDQLPAQEREKVLKDFEKMLASRVNLLLAVFLLGGKKRETGIGLIAESDSRLSEDIMRLL